MIHRNPKEDDVRSGELFSVIENFDVVTDDNEETTVEKGNVVEYVGPSDDQLKFRVHLSGGDTFTFDAEEGLINDFIEEIE
jgi:hypothetical protein